MKTLRIFISSPGDVAEERAMTKRVIQRLQGEFSGRIQLEPIYWEHEPLLATETFQKQIVRPSETDIVVCVLWSRLGTRLPAEFTRADGSRYASGTEFEFEDAVTAYREKGMPDLLIYRKTAEPVVTLKDKKSLLERLSQKEALEEFFSKWFHDEAEGTLVAAFHAFDTSADFEELLEVHLHKLIERRLPESVAAEEVSVSTVQWQEGSPYRGLDVFEFEHAPIFFGRTKAVADVLNALRAQAGAERAFVFVLGMSGGGKSSMVRAGVLPMLTQPGVIEGVGLWRRAIMRPSDSTGDLFDGLAAALLREDALPELSADRTDASELAKLLRETPKAAVPLIKGGLSQAAAEMAKNEQLAEQPVAKLVLVVDQMEEMFTLERKTHEERVAFIEALDALARSGRVWVIATLRSDFYPRCVELDKLVALKEGSGQYDLLAPTPAEIGQMIRQPAQAAGLRFEEDPETNERLDEVLRDAAARNPGALPLLEFTLEELYKQRTDKRILTHEAYKKLGGVEGALAQRAEELYSSLEPKVQSALGPVLRSLVSLGELEGEVATRRQTPLDKITATPETKALVEAFVEARLFTTDLADDGSAVVSVVHEALLQHWPRLQEWLEENKEQLRVRARVATAATRWQEEGKSTDLLLAVGKPLAEAEELLNSRSVDLSSIEKTFINASTARRRRVSWLKRMVVAALAVLTVAAGGAAYIANRQRDRAETEAETSKQVSEFLVDLFEVSDPTEAKGDTITAREILERGAKKIEEELKDQPEIQATLMNTMGLVYQSLGLYEQATPLLERALAVRRQLFGERHPEVAESTNNLALLLHHQGNLAAADSLYRTALEIDRKLLGDEHLEVAVTLNNLAALLREKGNYDESESLYREALSIRRTQLGDEHQDVALSLDHLAELLRLKGDYAGAEPLFREALAMRRKLLGEEHLLVARSMNNLAILCFNQGKLDEAKDLFRESLVITRKILGNEHPSLAACLNNLAFIHSSQGNYEEAEPLYRDALAIDRKMLGDEHPFIAGDLNNLAGVLEDKGDHSEAELLYREALAMNRRLLGKEHPKVANNLNNLACLLRDRGNLAEAEPLFREALAMSRSLLGDKHPQVASILNNLAILRHKKGDVVAAEPMMREALEIRQKALPEGHLKTTRTKSVLGSYLTELERFEEAEQLLLESYSVLKEKGGDKDKDTQETLDYLIELYDTWNKPDKAAEYRALLVGQKESSG